MNLYNFKKLRVILRNFLFRKEYKIESIFFKRNFDRKSTYKIETLHKHNLENHKMTGPRFEQTDFSLQPRSDAAIKLIANVPVRLTNKRIVSCDGGGGALGHPKIYINLDKNEENSCGYCGIRFRNKTP